MHRCVAALLLFGSLAFAQETLAVNEPVNRDLARGESHRYVIPLRTGDYAEGDVDKTDAPVSVAIYMPDGSELRSFPGSPDGKREFAFIAETAGSYRVELRSPSKASKYELRLKRIVPLRERLQPSRQDRYRSPRIDALRKQLSSGETTTEAFWRQVADEHTPLYENGEDQKYQLVTFLWRGKADTRNVMVLWFPFAAARPQDFRMHHMEGTDVWYLTARVPRGARFAYQLSPNDPMTFGDERASQRQATAQQDPLNPNRWQCGPNAPKFACQSVAELPDAPPQPWIVSKEGTPAGEVRKYTIKSEILNNEHALSVYAPPGYSADHAPYALLVLFDESAYLRLVPTPVILDNLIAAGKIPPMVAVLIANPSQATRSRELPPNPDFADFLAKELIPWTHSHYNVTSDPRETVVAGSSYGGIASTYAGLRHPELFGNVLCQSGSFWWAPDHTLGPDTDPNSETGWLAKQFISSPKLPLKFYMDAGTFEVDLNGNGTGILGPSRQMRDVLLAKGYEVHYHQFVGGHDYLSWRGTLADGLIALVGSERAESSETKN